MKRIRCPKCNEPITFDDQQYEAGRTLVFCCPGCNKQFKIRINPPKTEEAAEDALPAIGYLTVIENAFHYKQTIPLRMGNNVVGRAVKGSAANAAITTVDPSIDTTHCIITVAEDKQGKKKFTLRDAPSNTGTFLMNTLLGVKERVLVEEGAIITLGATTMILHTTPPSETEE